MSLSKDINAIHERAAKLFGGYTETNYVNGDSDEVANDKKVLNEKKSQWIDMRIKEAVMETMTALVDITNGKGNDVLVEGMVLGIHKTHRHLQSEFITKYLPEFLNEYGKTSDDVKYTDPRNEFAKVFATRMSNPQ